MTAGPEETLMAMIITGPVPADYAELPEDERLAVAAELAAAIITMREEEQDREQ